MAIHRLDKIFYNHAFYYFIIESIDVTVVHELIIVNTSVLRWENVCSLFKIVVST